MSPRPTVQEVGAIVGRCEALALPLPSPQEAERAALDQLRQAVRQVRIARIRARLAEGI